jgi:hypothetical protein
MSAGLVWSKPWKHHFRNMWLDRRIVRYYFAACDKGLRKDPIKKYVNYNILNQCYNILLSDIQVLLNQCYNILLFCHKLGIYAPLSPSLTTRLTGELLDHVENGRTSDEEKVLRRQEMF